jgi:predicted XRE-type DNA-binding protein
MPDAYLWFRRKTFPKIEDEGRAHIEIGGRGLDIVVILRTFLRADNLFNVTKVDCNIHNLEFSLSDTSHDFLYNTLIRMFSGTVKNDIEGSIENNIRDSLEQVNMMLRAQVAKARELSTSSVTDTLKKGISSSSVGETIDTLKQGISQTLGMDH